MRMTLPIQQPQRDSSATWASRSMVLALAALIVLATFALYIAGADVTSIAVVLGLAVGTLASEDLTLIAAGEAVRQGVLGLTPALVGCFVGIWVGDLGLWLVGRTGVEGWRRGRRMTRSLTPRRLDRLTTWLHHRTGLAVVAARFVPGLRFPMFVAAGIAGTNLWRFAGWTFVAAAVWTPLLVFGVIALGEAITTTARGLFQRAWMVPLAIAAIYAMYRCIVALSNPIRRARTVAAVSRIWRWEFWPAWLFYLPIVVYIVAKSIRRGGLQGFANITAANPGIPHGGFVGESKRQILEALPAAAVIPFVVVPRSDRPVDVRLNNALERLSSAGIAFPVIAKPDVGQCGAGVAKCETTTDLASALAQTPGDLILQEYHPGPYEVGIFYVRSPAEATGQIFSITEKVFPAVVGDGHSTIADLIWRHQRYRMQADVFLTRLGSDAELVLPAGQVRRLNVAGNHCQGTLFRDGRALLTPALAATVDQMARQFPGFHFGRFDIRYRDPDAFSRGEGLAIVELNGVTSESTNAYDPARSLIGAWLIFVRQWRLLFAIADQNVAAGHRATPWRELLRHIRSCSWNAGQAMSPN